MNFNQNFNLSIHKHVMIEAPVPIIIFSYLDTFTEAF